MENFDSIGDVPVSKIMTPKPLCVQQGYSIKTTIETFRLHKISCAPVTNAQGKTVGFITEHDLLIQAGSKPLDQHIEYIKLVIAVLPETSLKEVLVLFFSKRLKHVPVVDKDNFILGIISRIDVLSYLAANES